MGGNSGNLWERPKRVEAGGSGWKLTESDGNGWELWELVGTAEASGGRWKRVEADGGARGRMQTGRNHWKHMDICGSGWRQMGDRWKRSPCSPPSR
eukprot:gene3157-biopygen18686